jgi:hypothetical protein
MSVIAVLPGTIAWYCLACYYVSHGCWSGQPVDE